MRAHTYVPHPLPGFQLDHQYNTFPIHCPCSLSHSRSSPSSIQPNPIMFLDHLKACLSFHLVKSQLLPRVELAFHKLLVSPATTPSPSPKHMLSSHNLEPWDKLFIPWMPFLPALWSDKLLLILFNASSNGTCFVKCSLIAPGRVTHSCSRLPGSPPLVKRLSHHKYLLSRLPLPPTTGSKSMLHLILSIADITNQSDQFTLFWSQNPCH